MSNLSLGLGLGTRSRRSPDLIPPTELQSVSSFATTHDGQKIIGLDIWCDGSPLILQHKVVWRYNRISHRNGPGVRITAGASDMRGGKNQVQHVDPPEGVDGFPSIGETNGQNNIEVFGASNIRVDGLKLSHGASGIYMAGCDDVHFTTVEGDSFHGPFPRGQLYQQNGCTNCSINNWSVLNPVDASHPEDCINIYDSTGFYVGPGYAEGNNAPNGVAVMVETGSSGLVEDVDAVGMWNGAFGAWGQGTDAVFNRVRTRDNYAPGDNPGGRTPGSTSNGATFVAAQNAEAELLQAKYFNVSNPANVRVEFEDGVFTQYDAVEEDFTPRAPVTVKLPDWAPFVPPPPNPNLWADSAVPSNAAWTKNGVTVSAGTGEGGSDAVRETATTGEHLWSREWTKPSGATAYEIGIRFKPQGRTRLNLFAYNAAYSAGVIGYFFTATETAAPSAFGGLSNPTLSIEAVEDGFFLCTMAFTSATDTTMPVVFYTSAADYEQSHAGSTSAGFDVRELSLT